MQKEKPGRVARFFYLARHGVELGRESSLRRVRPGDKGRGAIYFALFIKDEMEKPPGPKDQAAGVREDEPPGF